MINCIIVGTGGFIGAILRYLIGLIKVDSAGLLPINTLFINVIGSFIIGIIVALSLKNSSLNPQLVLLIKVGFCGGFTTFSTFAFESLGLIESGRIGMATLYMVLSVTFSILAVYLAEILINYCWN